MSGSPPVRMALSIAEAAAALGISRDGFERYVLGELRVMRVGRRVLVPVKELERYVERNAARPLDAELEELLR